MGAKFGGNDDAPIVDINVTPLVDIVLVLLIIFMVTATYIVKPSIKVNLPEATTGEPTENSSLGLHLDKTGELSLNGEIIKEEPLRKAIRGAVLENKEVVCLIAADKDVPHGEVVGLMDLIRQEGVARFAINIAPKEISEDESTETQDNQ
jgi:biopolymer transport protein TolR